ncbi:MAG: hypothetical protein A2W03_02480 [Candidatus Aminicenantes bacterium RBG_16_63_16]|nr:MAG: hypothetical protein A2W03_02480 [Candidatus Aminicenantes bacterium RBG_16_63_16]
MKKKSFFILSMWLLIPMRPPDSGCQARVPADRPASPGPNSPRDRSYLEPPYCYDLNRWHGVTFIKAVNGRVLPSRFEFTYQDMTHLKVQMLRERAGLDRFLAEAGSELDLIRRLANWANGRFGHMQPLPYPSWDAHEVLDKAERGDAFWCTFKAALFVQACNAVGLSARLLGINKKDEMAHTAAEVYNNELRQWMLVDAWFNGYFEKDGRPLSALDLHRAWGRPEGIFFVFGENGCGMELWDVRAGRKASSEFSGKRIPLAQVPAMGYLDHYYDLRVVMRNDQTVHPQRTENLSVDGFMVPYNSRGGEWWGPQLHWVDETTPPQITADANSGEVTDFYWPLNEVRVDLKKISDPGEPLALRATFKTQTPDFSHFVLDINDQARDIVADTYDWKLTPGRNSLKIRSVNGLGRKGHASELVLDYRPVLPPEEIAAPALANGGFETADPEAEGVLRPADWSATTSNPFGTSAFVLDGGHPFKGRYSLKLAPAKDRVSGIEYAFIARSASFRANPASDVAYSVWLKADQAGRPVDIALLESTYKGQGTYVERVEVGRSWRKYTLKCRLHTGIEQAYVAVKVYTGTVWVDEAAVEQVRLFRSDHTKGDSRRVLN